jgi:toxin ParE1/3/4
MTRRVEVSPAAERDIDALADYIGRDSPRSAARFLQAVEDTIATLVRMPEAGELQEWVRPELAGLRCWQVRGFSNHLIFYRPEPDRIAIVCVFHGARDYQWILGPNSAQEDVFNATTIFDFDRVA